MEAITKKKFQEMLNTWDAEQRGNTHGAIVDGHWNGRYHQSKRLYGDYLRAQDPDKFSVEYNDFLAGEAYSKYLLKYL